MKRNFIYLVVDSSSSMGHLRTETLSTVNALIGACKQQSNDFETYLGIITFDNIARVVRPLQYIHHGTEFKASDYRPSGMTALFGAIDLAMRDLRAIAPKRYASEHDDSYLIIAITDGEENASSPHAIRDVQKAIEDSMKDGSNCTFTFQLPRGTANAFIQRYGVSQYNVREWEQTSHGMKEVADTTSQAVGSYFTARAAGASAVRNFYQPVTTDLSTATKQQVQYKLNDISKNFKRMLVSKEAAVKEFIEEKSKRPYVIGCAYYQLMKSEKVQPNKEILVLERATNKVYGGPAARQLVGLPIGEYAKVTPGNHGAYEIYIQSTSVNRKLPRGTTVLFDVTKTNDSAPTWI